MIHVSAVHVVPVRARDRIVGNHQAGSSLHNLKIGVGGELDGSREVCLDGADLGRVLDDGNNARSGRLGQLNGLVNHPTVTDQAEFAANRCVGVLGYEEHAPGCHGLERDNADAGGLRTDGVKGRVARGLLKHLRVMHGVPVELHVADVGEVGGARVNGLGVEVGVHIRVHGGGRFRQHVFGGLRLVMRGGCPGGRGRLSGRDTAARSVRGRARSVGVVTRHFPRGGSVTAMTHGVVTVQFGAGSAGSVVQGVDSVGDDLDVVRQIVAGCLSDLHENNHMLNYYNFSHFLCLIVCDNLN